MSAIFLFGGGWREAAYVRTFHDFLRAAWPKDGKPRIVVAIAEEDGLDKAQSEAQYRRPFEALGLDKDGVRVVFISAQEPLTGDVLREVDATGVFVADGWTPAYRAALCSHRSWWDHVREQGLPYAGFSAGAVILPERAIIGGWKQALVHMDAVILNEQASEQIEFLEVDDGLGTLPFAVEAHASQWGTLTRLVHAVLRQAVPSGWAIDEDTALRIQDDELAVIGLGQAYRVQRLQQGGVRVDVFGPGTVKQRGDW